ncbi:MAG: ATP-binding protein [Thermodesulfovibrionia bacterium]|nr:ATP-binding protein [Thermodesulfovibrionia bacterium]
MKKKILIGLTVFSLIFFVLTLYIIVIIETTTSELSNLIKLHQVEILREHLLINVVRTQSDLESGKGNYVLILTDTNNLGGEIEKCFDCHHTQNIKNRLSNLKNRFQEYEETVRRVSSAKGNVKGFYKEDAIAIGHSLIKELNEMITMTSSSLTEKTKLAMGKIEDTKIMLFVILTSGPLLVTVLSLVFIKSFTGPFNILLNATRRLKSGDLDYRIERLKDEFGEVAKSFNEMADSLKEQMLNMQRTEQLRVCGELATGLAHEIKNPLAGIKVSMEVLREDSSISEENRDVLLKAIKEVRRIELLLKELLNFARPPKPQFTPTNINNIIDISLTFSISIPHLSPDDSKAIKVLRDFDNNLPMIMADQMQLQQIFLNLLLNAVDAMPNGGTLAIKTSHDLAKNSIQVEIADTGKGIRKEMMDQIFQPFFTTKPKGTGMGLAITKRIVEEHGGNINVKSTLGEGTAFRIVLPVTLLSHSRESGNPEKIN